MAEHCCFARPGHHRNAKGTETVKPAEFPEVGATWLCPNGHEWRMATGSLMPTKHWQRTWRPTAQRQRVEGQRSEPEYPPVAFPVGRCPHDLYDFAADRCARCGLTGYQRRVEARK